MPDRIDVLCPVRLARRTLPSATGDILRQRGVDVRLIAVVDTGPGGIDDGSHDWLVALAQRESRVLLLRGPGQGAGAALDFALSAVEAPLVAHMEADDRCAPDRLALQAAALADESLAAVTCRAAQIGARTPGMRRYLDWQNALVEHRDMARERFIEIPSMHQTGLYRTEALRAIRGYLPQGDWPPDIDFWLRWFEHDTLVAPLRVAKLPRVLYGWRQHARQKTRGGGTHALDALRCCKAHYLARLHGRRGERPRPIRLLSTGATLEAWRRTLRDAHVKLVDAHDWKPGRAPPPEHGTELLLAAYGMESVRARVRAALAAQAGRKLDEPEELIVAA